MLLQLDSIIYAGKLCLDVKYMHLLVWTTTVILEMIPILLGVRYGSSPYWSETGVCIYVFEDSKRYKSVAIIGFLGLLIILVVTMFGLFLKIIVGVEKHMNAGRNRSLIFSVAMYPSTVFFSWLPFVIYVCTIISKTPSSSINVSSYSIFSSLLLWSYAGSLAFSILFFYNSAEARSRWSRLLSGILKGKWDVEGAAGEESDRVVLSAAAAIAEDFAIDTVLLENIADAEEKYRASLGDSIVIALSSSGKEDSIFSLSSNEIDRPSSIRISSNLDNL